MKSRTRNAALVVLGSLVAIAFLLAFVFFADYLRYSSDLKRASTIQIGDTRDEVRRIMGEPVAKFGISEVHSEGELWAYGRVYNPVSIFSFRLRLMSPLDDDVSIRFSAENTVVTVRIPEEAK
jgi:hypothetical protein